MINSSSAEGIAERYETPFKIIFWGFVGSIAFSLAGLLFLRLFPSSMDLFGPIYNQLVQAPTWLYMALLPIMPILMYVHAVGWPRMWFFIFWGCVIGGLSELMGTTELLTIGGTVMPFGGYEYTHWLGPRFADHVPYFIPPSWFAMSLISLDLARRVIDTRWGGVLLGALFMVIWDVSLDPAMNRAFPFWTFDADGFFFGMPLMNWVGWFIVSIIIIAGYEYIGGGLNSFSSWAPWVFFLNCFFPFMISLLQGLYVAGLIGMAATAIPFAAIWLSRQRVESSVRMSRS